MVRTTPKARFSSRRDAERATRRTMAARARFIRLTTVMAVLLFAAPLVADAQPTGKRVPRIGYLDGASLSANSGRIEAFRQGLRDLGYVEGQNLAIEWKSADGKDDRLPGLAAELVRLKVDAIVTGGAGATRPAKEATVTIPIVMAQDSDPVESGFVTSLARPGGNVTGLSTLHPAISAKRLEILKEVLPRLSRVAFFGTSTWAGNTHGLRETQLAAEALGLRLQYVDVSRPQRQVRGKLKPPLCWYGAPFLILAERKLQNWRSRAGSRRYTESENRWKPEGSWLTARTFLTCSGAPQVTWTGS